MKPFLLATAAEHGYELRQTSGESVAVLPLPGTPGCVRVFPSLTALAGWSLFRLCMSVGWANR